MSRWCSVDPPLITGKYLPTGDREHDENLPGMGGVLNPVNLNAYHYSGNNPINYIDIDGNDFMALVFPRGAEGWGHAAGVLIVKSRNGKIGYATLYEQGNWGNTPKKNKEKIRKFRLRTKVIFDKEGNPTKKNIKKLLREIHKYRRRIGKDDVKAAYIKTTKEQDKKIKDFSEARYKKPTSKREDYNETSNNCIDFVKDQARAADIDTPLTPFPKGAIEGFQEDNTGYNYYYKSGKMEETK